MLQAKDGPAVNYLLIGSDTRATADPNSADFGGIGDANAVSGQRSDTIMIMRQEKNGNGVSLLSLPRDLWVNIAGRNSASRINSAYSDGTDVLAATITQEFGIPINHCRRGRLRGLQGSHRHRRRHRTVLLVRHTRHQHRARSAAGMPPGRRPAGARSTPAAATSRSSATVSGARTRAVTSAGSNASRTSSTRPRNR